MASQSNLKQLAIGNANFAANNRDQMAGYSWTLADGATSGPFGQATFDMGGGATATAKRSGKADRQYPVPAAAVTDKISLTLALQEAQLTPGDIGETAPVPVPIEAQALSDLGQQLRQGGAVAQVICLVN